VGKEANAEPKRGKNIDAKRFIRNLEREKPRRTQTSCGGEKLKGRGGTKLPDQDFYSFENKI